ncbi:ParB/RepB/Spo0J family partition protein [Peptoniphilus stercorisuis]|uniref:ParB family chromosome partitioning protein n=1 Tax=Peptoniphilus stercorisuis TaxID=1436965 RepID=A0ABS4KCP7_9FIRM|nr:ParB/RepB/Spo0J family partition protein [Peptoniphilus stercorisuis]MBP2025537.1 ParB family chromosome partitioning protein [Peptoniphilus stercorisuis]
MAKKKGLGRGITNFIKDSEKVEEILNDTKKDELQSISIDRIQVNEEQARKIFDEEKIKELSESIKEYGILQPLVLRKDKDVFTIIAGERRYRAAKEAGLKEVPVLIKDVSKEDADKISLIENIQRQDLNPIEEALGYKSIMQEYSLTQEELASAIGKSRQYIGNTIRVLKLDKRVIDFLKDELLTMSHAKLLLSIKDKDMQYNEALRIIKSGSSVKDTEKRLNKNNKTEEELDIFMEEARKNLSDALGTKVLFKGSGKVKKIEIEYYSEEDLSRICDTIIRGEI